MKSSCIQPEKSAQFPYLESSDFTVCTLPKKKLVSESLHSSKKPRDIATLYSRGEGGGVGNLGVITGMRASISKPTHFICMAFEKTDPFIY